MKTNLERFQMTKLCPFQEKIQRQYLSTNVSLEAVNSDTVMAYTLWHLHLNSYVVPTAHRAFGGDVADGL